MSITDPKQRYVSTFRIYIKPVQNMETKPGNGPSAEKAVFSSGMSVTPSVTACEDQELQLPHFTEVLQDCWVDEGCDIVLRGVVTGSQPVHVSWLHNGKPVRFGEPSSDGHRVQLVVRECLPEDAGAYTCVAENTAGKTSSSAAVCVKDFETLYGIRKKKLDVPAPSKSLVRTGSLQSSNNIIQGESHKPQSTKNSTHTMRGTPKRRISSSSGLSVVFVDPLDQLEVQAGETARLQCSFCSTFPVATCWVHNREQVVDGPGRWVEKGEKSSTLVLTDASAEDAGGYTAVACDGRGVAQHTVNLIVLDLPQVPASCPAVSHYSDSSLVLSWSGPCYDGGSAIMGYVLEVKKERPGQPADWTEVTSHCSNTSYCVRSGLEPQGEYRFRVRAYNSVGVSPPSQESEVIKMDRSGQPKEEPQVPGEFIIDTQHKVSDHYNIMEKLGVGKFGQVFRLVHKETGRICAGKFYKGRLTKEREAARKEIELMRLLRHSKLVQCLGAYDNRREMVMVMEYIAGGELFERIIDDSFEHTEPTCLCYMRQILEGLQYVHQQNIVHLDLKPENVVCVNPSGTHIKIIDFGLACKLDPKIPLRVMQGTPEFVAPEVINFEPVKLVTDLWSIGVICYILLSGESPFQGSSDTETLARVTAAQWDFSESFIDITEQAKDFISSLLRKDVSWMAAFNSMESRSTKSLSKEKMKKFLARQKWKKTGKAVLALKRLALLSTKSDGNSSVACPTNESSLQPEIVKALEEQLLQKPFFSQTLMDQIHPRGSTVQLFCHIQGYPDPEVLWLHDEEPLEESDRLQILYDEDGRCVLVLSVLGPQDSGVYTCCATNCEGEAQCCATLTVQEVD